MSRDIGRLAVVAGAAVFAAAAATMVAGGCGGDDSQGGSAQDGGSADGTVADAPGQEDQVAVDMGTAPDSPVVVPMDSGNEGAATGDASDAAPIVVPGLTDFPLAVDRAYCTRLAACCALQPGQQWLLDTCVADFQKFGGAFGQVSFAAALDAGSIDYDRDAAANCLTTLAAINCGTVPSAAWDSLYSLCNAATKGTLGVDMGTCVNSLQCKPGEYCSSSDGGPGVCASLQQSGLPCADTTGSTDCSYRGTGSPQLYCGKSDAGTTCLAAQPLGGKCNLPVQCQSRLCNGSVAQCVTSYTFSDMGVAQGFCAAFTVDGGSPSDAGDAGD